MSLSAAAERLSSNQQMSGPVAIVEMAADRIAHCFTQRVEMIGPGENRVPQSARDKAAFRRFLDRKDDLAWLRTHVPTITAGAVSAG